MEIEFSKGLNVLIGENNTGKSAVIDALSVIFSLGDQKKEVYITKDDFHKNIINGEIKQYKDILFEIEFDGLSDEEQAIFCEMLSLRDDGAFILKLSVEFELTDKNKVRLKGFYGGDDEEKRVPNELLDLLDHVYLVALRDYNHELSPRRGSRIGQLFLKIESKEEKQKEHAERLHNYLESDNDWKNLINRGKEKINSHFEHLSLVYEPNKVEIELVPLEFQKLVENLQLKIPLEINSADTDSEKRIFFDLSQIGLGYGNLIYISTVLGDLIERKETEPYVYSALLIEEPEAHIHPQLQSVLFKYLEKITEKGVQVFVTSHSPTITAKTTLDSIIVLHKNRENKIMALPLRKCPLDNSEKLKLQRFLDVTKCQLFFAKGVILVEGISEALLLPIFARIMGDEYELDRNGIEIVNIGGVAFEPFAKLFNNEDVGKRLNVRCSIITDGDEHRNGGIISSRANNVRELESGNLKVFLAKNTFEYELVVAGDRNWEIIKNIYFSQHPRTDIAGSSIEEKAKDFLDKLDRNRDKALLAQLLAERLENNPEEKSQITVPRYIKGAIRWVIRHENSIDRGTEGNS